MAAFHDLFEVLVATHGSGWKGIHVNVKNWMIPAEFTGNRHIVCLTNEAVAPDEFDQYIDQVIDQLQNLKKEGRKKLSQIKAKKTKPQT